MSIQSMTGFGKGESENDNYSLSVEIKSVNHRFKDLRFKMGSVFNSQEMSLKKKIETLFQRGSFDIYVNYKKNVAKIKEIEIDYDKVEKFVAAMKVMSEKQNVSLSISPTDFLRQDFYVEDEQKEAELNELLMPAFDKALDSLMESRNIEGEKLITQLKEHKSIYTEFYSKIGDLKSTYQDQVKERILKKFDNEKNDLKIDEPRFLQEVIYYLEKLDIDEEINRIKIHLEKLDSVLNSNQEVGRQIDFLMQELNRETNTIGSKSGNSDISENVVQMKVQLEKIREQALNLQ